MILMVLTFLMLFLELSLAFWNSVGMMHLLRTLACACSLQTLPMSSYVYNGS